MTDLAYRSGSDRAVHPQTTLARILPLLSRFGVTRIADITGLDRIGIPTYAAIRPGAQTLQVSNGKGRTRVDAQVGAVMEAFELACGEGVPSQELRLASVRELANAGEAFHFELPQHVRPNLVPMGRFEWVRGADLCSGWDGWVPAATAWKRPRQAVSLDWSGLASGNTMLEATLHALYEILERHMMSAFVSEGRLSFATAGVVNLRSKCSDVVEELVSLIEDAGLKLVLLRSPSPLRLHAFMAVLLDPSPFSGASAVNVGYGAHLSPAVAATRAITESAQSRLTYIHGARDDLRKGSYVRSDVHARLYRYFDSMSETLNWNSLHDASSLNLQADLDFALREAERDGLSQCLRIDMTPSGVPFFVTKLIVPSARFAIPC